MTPSPNEQENKMIEKCEKLQKSIELFQKQQTPETADRLLVDLKDIQSGIDELKTLCYEIIDKAGETEHFKSYGKHEYRNLKSNAVKKLLEENGLMSPDLFVVNSFLMIRRKKESPR